jgi:organic radical activating enzyme
MSTPVLTAALAGVPSGIQAQGIWQGRRQLFVRFAGEAETATMYRADALAREIDRILGRSQYHSISISGRDALGNPEFLAAVLAQVATKVPVMVDTDGERPEAIGALKQWLKLVQVTLELSTNPRPLDRPLETLRAAAAAGCDHALVLIARDDSSDAQLIRIVEQAHGASAGTMIVVHPGPAGERPTLDRRWATLIEQAIGIHSDTRLAIRIPGPAALR